MRTIGNIERFLVLGIVVVIGAILTVAITGARDLETERSKQVAAKSTTGTATGKSGANKANNSLRREPKPVKPPADPSGQDAARGTANPAANPAIRDAIKLQQAALNGELEKPVAAMPPSSDVAPALEPVDGPNRQPASGAPTVIPLHKEDDLTPRDPGLAPPGRTPADDGKERDYYYEVRKSDTLERIARSLYGDGQLWKEILAANPTIADAQRIKVGDTLKLPRAPTVADATVSTIRPGDPGLAPSASLMNGPKATTPAELAYKRITDRDSYQVQKGDTLMSIAAANYGTKAAWQIILAANSDKLVDKDRLKTGMTLKLPSN